MMTSLLVFNKSRLTQAHISALENGLSDVSIDYCEDSATEEQLKNAEIIFGNPSPKLLPDCRRLKLVQLMSAGSDAYVDFLPDGCVLANATGGYGLAISEHMLATLLCLNKKLHLYYRNQAEGLWRDEGKVTSIHGSVALIVGLGDIGGEFAKRIHALGGYTIGVRRAGTDKPDYLDELYATEALDSLLPRADTIALCLPNTSQTAGIMSKARFKLLKPSAILLNVGRGSAVDQDELNRVLRAGLLGGAGLDVTEPEPLPEEHPLWSAPNTIITPHISGFDHLPETYNRIVKIAIDNIKAVQSGLPIRNEVDPATGYRRLIQ